MNVLLRQHQANRLRKGLADPNPLPVEMPLSARNLQLRVPYLLPNNLEPITMGTLHNTLLKTGLCTALLINFAIVHAAKPPALPVAEDAVELTGWLHVESLTMEDVVLEVEVNGTYQTARVSNTGRFNVMLPADSKATLRFEKPGHLPKEVVVDTRFVRDGDRGEHTRHVKFAVILELERFMGGMTYAGPVGSIGFDPGGGCVAVAHDTDLVPAKRNTPMVF